MTNMNTAYYKSCAGIAVILAVSAIFLDTRDYGTPRASSRHVNSLKLRASVVLTPAMDTYVGVWLNGAPPTELTYPRDNQLVLYVDIKDRAPERYISFVQFDLSAIPSNTHIDKAELQLFTKAATYDVRPVRVNASAVLSPWATGTITPSNIPTIGSVVASESTADKVNGWSKWDITQLVQGWVSGSPNNGLALTVAENAGVRHANNTFSSRESDNPPKLLINSSSLGDGNPIYLPKLTTGAP